MPSSFLFCVVRVSLIVDVDSLHCHKKYPISLLYAKESIIFSEMFCSSASSIVSADCLNNSITVKSEFSRLFDFWLDVNSASDKLFIFKDSIISPIDVKNTVIS